MAQKHLKKNTKKTRKKQVEGGGGDEEGAGMVSSSIKMQVYNCKIRHNNSRKIKLLWRQ